MARRRGKGAQKQDDPLLLADPPAGQSRALSEYVLPGAFFLILLIGGSTLCWLWIQQQQAIEDLSETLTTVQTRVTRLQQQLGSGNAQLASVDGFEERLLALEESYAKAQRQAEVALAASEQINSKDLQNKVWALQTEMTSKLSELHQNTISIASLNAIIKNKSEEFEAVKQNVRSILSSNSELAVSISGLTSTISVTEARLDEHILVVDALMSQLEGHKREISEMKESFTSSQDVIDANAQELKDIKDLLELEQVKKTQADRGLEDHQTSTDSLHSHFFAQLEAVQSQFFSGPQQEEVQGEEQEETADGKEQAPNIELTENQVVKEEEGGTGGQGVIEEEGNPEEVTREEEKISEELGLRIKKEVAEETEQHDSEEEKDVTEKRAKKEEEVTEQHEAKEKKAVNEKQGAIKEETVAEQYEKKGKKDVAEKQGAIEEEAVAEQHEKKGKKDVAEKQGAIEEEAVAEKQGAIEEEAVAEKQGAIEEEAVAEQHEKQDKKDVAEKQGAIEEEAVAEQHEKQDKKDVAEKQGAIEEEKVTEQHEAKEDITEEQRATEEEAVTEKHEAPEKKYVTEEHRAIKKVTKKQRVSEEDELMEYYQVREDEEFTEEPKARVQGKKEHEVNTEDAEGREQLVKEKSDSPTKETEETDLITTGDEQKEETVADENQTPLVGTTTEETTEVEQMEVSVEEENVPPEEMDVDTNNKAEKQVEDSDMVGKRTFSDYLHTRGSGAEEHGIQANDEAETDSAAKKKDGNLVGTSEMQDEDNSMTLSEHETEEPPEESAKE